jgi:hypothetical protein
MIFWGKPPRLGGRPNCNHTHTCGGWRDSNGDMVPLYTYWQFATRWQFWFLTRVECSYCHAKAWIIGKYPENPEPETT